MLYNSNEYKVHSATITLPKVLSEFCFLIRSIFYTKSSASSSTFTKAADLLQFRADGRRTNVSGRPYTIKGIFDTSYDDTSTGIGLSTTTIFYVNNWDGWAYGSKFDLYISM